MGDLVDMADAVSTRNLDDGDITIKGERRAKLGHAVAQPAMHPTKVFASGKVDLKIRDADGMKVDAGRPDVFDHHFEQTGEIVALCRIHRVVVYKVPTGIEDRLAPVAFNALDSMVGMSPVQISAEVDEIVRQRLGLRRGRAPVRADMRAHDDQLRNRSGLRQGARS